MFVIFLNDRLSDLVFENKHLKNSCKVTSRVMPDFSTKRISQELLKEIKVALKSVKMYGSVEIYVQRGVVTQITVRNIKKTNHINGESAKSRSQV